jgi:RHS repeat-associated protein
MYRRPANAADVRWYAYDGGGNVVGEIDPAGNVTASKKHDVFGLSRGGSGTAASKHGWQGQVGHQSDGESGLVYMRARYYAPELGRFQSEDPKGDGANWFTYCTGDPVNKTDPTGKETNINDGSYGYLMIAFSMIEFFFLVKYGDGRGLIVGTIAAIMAAYLIADALQDVGSGSAGANSVASLVIGTSINLIFEHLTKPEKFITKYVGAVANIIAGMTAYYGICELYMILM